MDCLVWLNDGVWCPWQYWVYIVQLTQYQSAEQHFCAINVNVFTDVTDEPEIIASFFDLFWMWSLKLSFSSRNTPRNLIFDGWWIFVFPISILSKVFFQRLLDVPMIINSVLASFIFSWLSPIQVLIFPISLSIICLCCYLDWKSGLWHGHLHILIGCCLFFLEWFPLVYWHSIWTK